MLIPEPNIVAKGIKCADCPGLGFSTTPKMNTIPNTPQGLRDDRISPMEKKKDWMWGRQIITTGITTIIINVRNINFVVEILGHTPLYSSESLSVGRGALTPVISAMMNR